MTEGSSMLWGGRFAAGPDPDMMSLTRSLPVDITLLECDALATKAHVRVLASAGLLEDADLSPIEEVLDELIEKWRAGHLDEAADEDVHTLVERVLTERLGEVGARIHAGRSRNDLVAADLRLWCKSACDEILDSLGSLVSTLADRAEDHVDVVMPGFTHLQPAQPVSLGFHLAAHGFGLLRDGGRIRAARRSADVSVLGAGALAGTTLPLDADVARTELGFSALFDNAMDAVADRDFLCDLLYALATIGVHLSRLAEEIVVWSSPALGFVTVPDDWSTGSSMMPNKRNPDMAELVRGRAAGSIGDLTGLLSLLKALPLAYDRDLQEDKTYVFSGVERTLGCLRGMVGLVGGLRFEKVRLAELAGVGGTWATDVAELLVGRGVPFRRAHEAAGRLVAEVESRGGNLDEKTLVACHPLLEAGDIERLSPVATMSARLSHGGTAPEQVGRQIATLRAGVGSLSKRK